VSDLPTYPQDAAEREEAAPPPGGERDYAGWGRRVGAYLLDVLILIGVVLVIGLVVGIIVGASSDGETGAISGAVVGYVLSFVFPFIYFTFFHGDPRGQTPGKRAVGIRVVREETGASIGYGRALGRYAITVLFAWLLFLPLLLDYLWPLWDDKNQALHDKVVGSVVIRAT
jgi:uncharacterized RDD family membrane protein YckC